MKKEITKEQLELLIPEVNTREDLAIKLNVSLSTIKRNLKKFNLSFSELKKKFSKEDFMKLYDLGYNDYEIAKNLNVGRTVIMRFRNKLSLKSNFEYSSQILYNNVIELAKTLNEEEIAKKLELDVRVINYYLNSRQTDLENKNKLSKEQFQIILGGLLGDSNISPSRSKNLYSYIFAHSGAQKEYAIWKASKLSNLGHYDYVFKESEQYDSRTGNIYYSHRFYSYQLPVFKNLFNRFYIHENDKNIKVVPNIVNKLDALGLAIWYMDDGCRSRNTFYLCTEGFSGEENEKLVSMLKRNFSLNVHLANNNEICIPKEETPKFVALIEPYLLDMFKYKIPEWLL